MTIQQMLLGGKPPLQGSGYGFNGQVINPLDPSPPRYMTVSASGGVIVTGGTGSYTYTWSIASGNAFISSSSGSGATISASVPNHFTVSGNVRCVINDGVSSITVLTPYSLYYSGGIPV